LLIAGFLSISGCSGTNGPSKDHIVAGVNLTALFAPPTSVEKTAIRQDWSSRDATPHEVAVVDSAHVALGFTGASVRVIAFHVGGVLEYGAIIVPDSAAVRQTPVVVYCHPGDGGEDVNYVLSIIPYALVATSGDFIYVIPSFRGEPLYFQSIAHNSAGTPSPWDRDVDDASALLTATFAITPTADSTRVGAVGFSRGGGVALLLGERDSRVDLVVEFFGPTDFFSEFTQGVVEDALQDSLRDLPGLTDLNTQVIQPLKTGQITIGQARLEILRRSPVYFLDRLPPTQGHHGTADEIVPVSEGLRLQQALTDAGMLDPDYHIYIYQGGGHDPTTLDGSFGRARSFLQRLVTHTASFAGAAIEVGR
jgi:dipeptidyl aminopeptidase/acylaminoacyl peptidase